MSIKKSCKKASQTRGKLVNKASAGSCGALVRSQALNVDHVRVIENWIELNGAAEILRNHLGKNIDDWLDFLRNDASLSKTDADEDADMMWTNRDRIPFCSANDLYRYIASKNPKSLGLYALGSSASKSPYDLEFAVNPVVDHENGGRLLIQSRPPEGRLDTSLLTVSEARELANRLLEAAQYCESHAYDYFLGLQTVEDQSSKSQGSIA